VTVKRNFLSESSKSHFGLLKLVLSCKTLAILRNASAKKNIFKGSRDCYLFAVWSCRLQLYHADKTRTQNSSHFTSIIKKSKKHNYKHNAWQAFQITEPDFVLYWDLELQYRLYFLDSSTTLDFVG